MHRSTHGHGFVPPTDFLPDLPSSSPDSSGGYSSPQVRHDPQFQERLRMARFRFPPPPAPASMPAPVDIDDVFSPLDSSSPRNSRWSQDVLGDQLSDLIFNPYWTHKHGSLAQGQSFGMLNFEDAMAPEATEQVPDTPPPTYDEVEANPLGHIDEKEDWESPSPSGSST